ncbi:hypothetical protein KO533_21550 [Shewanella sp. NKUCC05_KAH]|uniref:hypothetical protein n=1 Tax=Shewanella sp. NKUCC05_KAH TaxID=2842126 RepID=UPI001C5B044D|nr:hypothetical protein [Shewanella sp. NKUCC05_KAH]MBW3529131.1 hypothetical protein [Shewanella sp. NKUCC05_KAH]
MTKTVLEQSYTGSRYTVKHCSGAIDTFTKALKKLDSRKVDSFTRGMNMQIERLANGHRLSNENFPIEGDLPKVLGKQSAKKFHALKRIPIRGYCWLSENHASTYFISHYIYKDFNKLRASDTQVVRDNWERIEVNNEEF